MTHSQVNGAVKSAIRARHDALLTWMRRLPLFHETPDAIWTHAGLDDSSGELWRLATEDYVFVNKYPATFGLFLKTIVAGHVGTESLHRDGSHLPYFDGHSHWYIDGSAERTGKLNVLQFDTESKEYTYFVAQS